jgi:hypothetical protein
LSFNQLAALAISACQSGLLLYFRTHGHGVWNAGSCGLGFSFITGESELGVLLFRSCVLLLPLTTTIFLFVAMPMCMLLLCCAFWYGFSCDDDGGDDCAGAAAKSRYLPTLYSSV